MDGKTGAVVLSFLMMGVAACGAPETGSSSGGGGASSTTTTTSGGAGGTGGAQATSAYDPDHVYEVAITMDPADWDKLRYEVNDLSTALGGDCLAGPRDSVYNYYPGSVTIDGLSIPKIDVRKKGFFGSMSVSRPSLKLKLDAYDPAANFFGVDKLTFNNMKQDTSLLRTCLAFKLFSEAGVPTPRCAFAHISVNGKDLGVFASVETLDKTRLGELFTDGSGNLYEGVMSDFRPGWENTYEKKTNTADPDRSDIQALTDALTAPDAELLSKLEPIVDVDAFLTYWASEAVLASWDGYSNDQNNHLVYHDPTSGKLLFVPWTPDATLGSDSALDPSLPKSVYGMSALPNRLYGLPEVRQSYRTRLLDLVDKMLVKGPAQAEIDRMEKLLAPYADKGDGAWKADVDVVRQFVKDQPGVLQAEVAAGPFDFQFPAVPSPCMAKAGTISGSFSTKMDTLSKGNPFGTGTGKVHIEIGATPVDAGTVGSAAELSTTDVRVVIVGVLPGGSLRVVTMLFDPAVFAAGDLPFDVQQVLGVYGTVDDQNNFHLEAMFDNGTVHLDKASLTAGDAITGTFSADALSYMP